MPIESRTSKSVPSASASARPASAGSVNRPSAVSRRPPPRDRAVPWRRRARGRSARRRRDSRPTYSMASTMSSSMPVRSTSHRSASRSASARSAGSSAPEPPHHRLAQLVALVVVGLRAVPAERARGRAVDAAKPRARWRRRACRRGRRSEIGAATPAQLARRGSASARIAGTSASNLSIAELAAIDHRAQIGDRHHASPRSTACRRARSPSAASNSAATSSGSTIDR